MDGSWFACNRCKRCPSDAGGIQAVLGAQQALGPVLDEDIRNADAFEGHVLNPGIVQAFEHGTAETALTHAFLDGDEARDPPDQIDEQIRYRRV